MHVTVPQHELAALRQYLAKGGVPYQDGPIKVHQFKNLPCTRLASGSLIDTMTGERVPTSLARAQLVASHRFESMVEHGLHPLRVKIECPADQYPQSDEEGYYESHMRVLGVPWMDHVPGDVGAHRILVSKSLVTCEWHATVRSRGCSLEVHKDRVERAARVLHGHRVQVIERPRHEYVEMDSNRAHDNLWEGRKEGNGTTNAKASEEA